MRVTIFIDQLLRIYTEGDNSSPYLCITIRDNIIKSRLMDTTECSHNLKELLAEYFNLIEFHYESHSIDGWFVRFIEDDDYCVTGKYVELSDGDEIEFPYWYNMRDIRIKMLEYVLAKNPRSHFSFNV